MRAHIASKQVRACGKCMEGLRNHQQYKLVEHDDHWVIPLDGSAVCRIEIGYAFKLDFIDANLYETTIWLGGNISLKIDATTYEVRGDDPSTLAPVVGLWLRIVEKAFAHKDGQLELRFRDTGFL